MYCKTKCLRLIINKVLILPHQRLMLIELKQPWVTSKHSKKRDSIHRTQVGLETGKIQIMPHSREGLSL
jgi:hypothetical protein